MRVIELHLVHGLRTGRGGNQILTHVVESPEPRGAAELGAGRQTEPAAMTTDAIGVSIALGLERYFVPWSEVRTARYPDAEAPRPVDYEPPPSVAQKPKSLKR